ncbi:uncharacterized protein LOC130728020 isoform X2 [Lotus japonicus]|uniref:uncharacterized protein LOC130728020 isoform X2 n=1 Tax=Lotus japonicus TaxID=34305 RepID=UPI00258AC365|nr:uncharacterized protein LOC130728020 isoform X2 [Lotus japonicus]XP_057435331.1 uncharacterized protein LOC130728020 isoform X2 [Lotus japonicus]XP_057435332.1 uncharacterized protein LOC130728020 isoform X2 [Lotus japonicus]XP_057435333.1 uncharacterized protein LOC130728020 isoform X2 [Lotus japonicus]XP_057435334.1 uncharacterized protein LOC130728020 isoform X2 [Lotus japonicus]
MMLFPVVVKCSHNAVVWLSSVVCASIMTSNRPNKRRVQICRTCCLTCIQDGLWIRQSLLRKSVLLSSASVTIGMRPACRNKHIMIDLGTGNNNKINWAMKDKQEFIDIIETVYRGARKGRGLVIAPKDYSTKYRY